MAADPDRQESNANRVTTALVYRAVDDLKELTSANFETVHARLDALGPVPVRLETVEHEIDRLKRDVKTIKESDAMQQSQAERRKEYRIGTLPQLLIAGAGLILTVVNVFVLTSLH